MLRQSVLCLRVMQADQLLVGFFKHFKEGAALESSDFVPGTAGTHCCGGVLCQCMRGGLRKLDM